MAKSLKHQTIQNRLFAVSDASFHFSASSDSACWCCPCCVTNHCTPYPNLFHCKSRPFLFPFSFPCPLSFPCPFPFPFPLPFAVMLPPSVAVLVSVSFAAYVTYVDLYVLYVSAYAHLYRFWLQACGYPTCGHLWVEAVISHQGL